MTPPGDSREPRVIDRGDLDSPLSRADPTRPRRTIARDGCAAVRSDDRWET